MPDNAPKWTPGPWTYAPIPGYQYVVEIDKPAQVLLVAAAVHPGREAEIRANMQLAAAAPDLYAALDKYVEHFGDPLKVARAALAKARGERTDGQ
jgi:hypothetical protein